ncbi:MAG: arginine--tRNA ligase [Firmicutes bacterium]|nr:arginine--tRNA ligase [Bacillota bacterium]
MQARLAALVEEAVAQALAEGDLPPLEERPEFRVEIPNDRSHGDFATNAALALARPARQNPRAIAQAIVRWLKVEPPIAEVSVAGPGFINFRLVPSWLNPVVTAARRPDWGSSAVGGGRRILVEFVSANPTGPLNLVNARSAAYGDALCRVLAAAGYHVEREYYVNDAGNQFQRFADAVRVRYMQAVEGRADVELPEGAYPGEYIIGYVQAAVEALGGRGAVAALPEEERVERLARWAVERIIAEAQDVLARYRVRFDRWMRESELRERGVADAVFRRLVASGHTYVQDGAVWLRTTAFGDDKDRVLRRADGTYTYIVPDIAYHADKLERCDIALDILGQDHHGYVPRLRAALAALGYDTSRLEVLINQMVHLVRGGERVRMSKRRGEFVTMEEFLGEVDIDAARWFFAARALDSTMEFDLDLANLRTNENPVYYVQYAHARIASLLERAAEAGAWPVEAGAGGAEAAPYGYEEPAERALLWEIARFPEEVAQAAELRAPHRLAVYARELAAAYHTFYTDCRVLGAEPPVQAARLLLSDATRHTLARCLDLLGVSAPERM